MVKGDKLVKKLKKENNKNGNKILGNEDIDGIIMKKKKFLGER